MIKNNSATSRPRDQLPLVLPPVPFPIVTIDVWHDVKLHVVPNVARVPVLAAPYRRVLLIRLENFLASSGSSN